MKNDISIAQLEYALSVERHGSFSAAARAMHVSQPALSEMVLKLEKTLGVTLFDRRRNPVGVTDVGRELLAQARRAVSETLRFQELAGEWQREPRGELRIGLIPTLAPALIPVFLRPLRQRIPSVRIELLELPTAGLIPALEENEIDVAILSPPSETPGHFLERTLFYEPFRVYASRGSPLLRRKELTLEDLESQNLILMDESHCARDQVETLCRRRAAPPTTVRGGLQTLLAVIDQEDSFTLIPELLSGLVGREHLRDLEHGRHTRKVSFLLNRAHLRRKLVDILAEEILSNLPKDLPRKREQGLRVIPPDPSRFE